MIDDLKATHGENLASVILYGSAAAGDFVAQPSDYNLLIALKEIRRKICGRRRRRCANGSDIGHPVPVYFTVRELKTAADVFPIEFHQMERRAKFYTALTCLKI